MTVKYSTQQANTYAYKGKDKTVNYSSPEFYTMQNNIFHRLYRRWVIPLIIIHFYKPKNRTEQKRIVQNNSLSMQMVNLQKHLSIQNISGKCNTEHNKTTI